MFFTVQKTLDQAVSCQGIGVHSNQSITLTLKPAPIDHGIVFVRSDLKQHNIIPAHYNLVHEARFCTVLENEHGISVSTVEHVMAALAAYSVTNVVIEVSGSEVPIMDGSSRPFINMLTQAGIFEQHAAKPFINILEKVEISEHNRFASFEPDSEFSIVYSIDFQERQNMKPQTHIFHCSQQNFSENLCAARSFGFLEDAEKLWALGLAKGSSLDNAVVIDQGEVLNPDGLRYENEMVRHKILDALGDLALAGMGIRGRLTIHNGGHEMNNRILRQLLNTPTAFEVICPPLHTAVIKNIYSQHKHHTNLENLSLSA